VGIVGAVFNKQNIQALLSHFAQLFCGRENLKVEPWFSSDSTQSLPPCSSRIFRHRPNRFPCRDIRVGVQALKEREDPLVMLRSDPQTIVRTENTHVSLSRRRKRESAGLLGAIFYGVAEKVLEKRDHVSANRLENGSGPR